MNRDKDEDRAERPVLLSAGGTGGHVTPAAALALDMQSRGFRVELVTDERGRRFAGMFGGIPVHVISAGTLTAGLKNKIRGLAGLGKGLFQAYALIGRIRPCVVVGFGGYPSMPPVFVAQRRKIPTIIHEQNAILGRANTFLAHRAERIALSMPHTDGLDEADAARAVVTGNPVRETIAALFAKPYPALRPDGPLRIFVMGGSLGAQVFSDVVPAALARLTPERRARIEVVQQCRAEDMEAAREIYAQAGIRARLDVFFGDVPDILASCHLFIGRSGASTVAEVTAAGRPAIFVPYPHHPDQQQKINAGVVADTGGAWVMAQGSFTPETLQSRIETFLQHPEMLFHAAEAARGCGRPDAARRLGNLVTTVVSGWS